MSAYDPKRTSRGPSWTAVQIFSPAVMPLRHDSVGFNLHEPLRIDKTRHLDESGRRADRPEKFSVRTCCFTPRCHIEKQHARSGDVLKVSSGFDDSRIDDFQTSFGLSVDVS